VSMRMRQAIFWGVTHEPLYSQLVELDSRILTLTLSPPNPNLPTQESGLIGNIAISVSLIISTTVSHVNASQLEIRLA
jgi:hypothetical protein